MNILKSLAALFAATTLLASCAGSTEDSLRTGDLIFVGIPVDYSLDEGSMSDAITSSTGNPDSLNIIHVAIAEVQGDSTWIIDATIKHGVDRHPVDTFFSDFTLRDGSLPVFIVKRLVDDSLAGAFVDKAKEYVGLAYDLYFMPDNDSLYCSELVRDSYVLDDGTCLFEASPMNFRDADGEFPPYWTQLFGRLGVPIPQDVLGTNPQAMSASPLLRTVNIDITR